MDLVKNLKLIELLSDNLSDKGFMNILKEISKKHSLSPEELSALEKEKEAVVQKISEFEQSHPSNPCLKSSNQKKYKRIYIDGCFDLMHSGHFNAIRQAKELTETLVVGVISDEQIRMNKGPSIMTLKERVTLAQACKWADEVVVVDDYNPTIELLDSLNCSHSVHGDDIVITNDGQDGYKDIKDANRMILVKRTEGISTTDIVGRLLLLTKNHHMDNNSQINILRKMSGDNNNEGVSDKIISQQKKNVLPEIKLLNTTKRIRQFSNNRDVNSQDKVIYIDGNWDIVHEGHIKNLQKAKSLGSYLIVGLHDDETINKIKGRNYPVLNLQERTLNILALKYVDEVIIGAPWQISKNMIKNMNIQMVVEGGNEKHDQEMQFLQFGDPYQYAKEMNIYHKLDQVDSKLDQDEIVQRIIQNRRNYLEAQLMKKKKQDNYYKTETNLVKEM